MKTLYNDNIINNIGRFASVALSNNNMAILNTETVEPTFVHMDQNRIVVVP